MNQATTAELVASNDLPPLQMAYLGYLAQYHGNTFGLYKFHLDRYLAWCAASSVDPLTVKRTHLEVYVRHLLTEGKQDGTPLKASSVNTSLTPVKGFYKFAASDEYILRNPAEALKLPRVHYELPKAVPDRDITILLETAREIGPRHWACTQMLVGLGMRISEAREARIEEYLPNKYQGHKMLRYRRKGGKIRTVPIPLGVLEAVEAARGDRTHGTILTTLKGEPMSRSAASGLIETVNRRAAKAGCRRRCNPHMFRKIAISSAIESGMSIQMIQEFSGHEDPRTIFRHYALERLSPHRHPNQQIAAKFAVDDPQDYPPAA